MKNSKLLVYLDPGFLDNRGHYKNFAKNIHTSASNNGVDIDHYVGKQVPDISCQKFDLIPFFEKSSFLTDHISDDYSKKIESMHSDFAKIIQITDASMNMKISHTICIAPIICLILLY